MQVHCKYDALVNVKDLQPHPKNRNKHSEDQIKRLAQILTYQGIRAPIVISRLSDCIVKGHGTLEAIKRNKWAQAPAVYQDFENEEQEYAFVQSDNAIAAWAELDLSGINADIGDLGPDFDIDLLGIKDFVLEPAEKIPECDEDEVPDPTEPISKLGDLWILGKHRLLCGDSTNIQHVDQLMNGEIAELCFTSPPYSDQREYNGGKELSTEYLAKFISTAYGKVNYFAVNLGYSRKEGAVNQYWNDYTKEAQACGLKLLSWNVWDKGHCGSIGNQNAMFGISHEWIFVFGSQIKELNRTIENSHFGERTNHAGNRQKDGSIKKSKEGKVGQFSQLKTVYSIPPQMARDEINHPARFPVYLPEGYIEAMTNDAEYVYEPFAGSGSTLIACEKTNRKCFMMELDPHYCDVIIARWEKYTGQKAKLNG